MSVSLEPTRIAIIGLGLIGGSIARGLKAAGHTGCIVGCTATPRDAQYARQLGLVDEATSDPAVAARGAALVVLAVPVGAMAQVLTQIHEVLAPDATVTDVGSTKVGVIADARAALGERFRRFVPGHPIAGTEYNGLDAGFAELYTGRRVILTPNTDTDRDAVARVETLWQTLGGHTSHMDAAHHDEVLAATSHLPHVLAFALVDSLARMAERTEIFEYAAGGFADFTRIASSDPDLWSDIVTSNQQAVLDVLDRYRDDLTRLRGAIAAGDRQRLSACFTRAKTARDAFAGRPAPDAG